ncbi:MAG TPA: non-homologous end-joining DNA ligase [Polyangiales bacterium]
MATATARTKLTEYNRKRRFNVTPEPRGSTRPKRAPGGPQFVVQKHAASHLHYDFRLEHDGVLLSWAVPKGPSLSPSERRLAMRTEDHPLDYAQFEGVIPEGEYGGGHVLVWDRGTWEPERDVQSALTKGRLTFTLRGQKLRGRFHLARTKAERGRERWLLFKGTDSFVSEEDIVTTRPESVLSGKTVEEVSGPVWHSNRAPKLAKARRATKPRAGRAKEVPGDDIVRAVSSLRLGFPLTNLEKVLYPEQGLRKADLIAYTAAVAPRMLPHVANRPLVLVRCPQGRGQKCFYQKNVEDGVPGAVHTLQIQETTTSNHYAYVKDMAGLAALAQLGVLEVHMWGCHVDRVENPDLFVFDLDPGDDVSWERVVEAAQRMRERLGDLGLRSFVKTTGGKGLHVVAPVQRKWSWDEHKAISLAVVAELARREPDRYLLNMRKQLRTGKIFLDYLRNGRGATAIAPYSTRAREGATVATPLTWEELEQGVDPRSFTVPGVVERLHAQKADPWASFFKVRQRLSAAAVRKLLETAKAKAR